MFNQPKPIERALAEAFRTRAGEVVYLPAADKEQSRPYSRKVTVNALVEMPEWKGVFSRSAVRALIDKSRPRFSSRGVIAGNGLIEAGAIIRIGRKILIDCDRFRQWVEAHRVSSGHGNVQSADAKFDL